MSTLTPPTREQRAPGTTVTTLSGPQRRADDRRRVLVSATLATIRGDTVSRRGQRPLERARAVLGRMRAT